MRAAFTDSDSAVDSTGCASQTRRIRSARIGDVRSMAYVKEMDCSGTGVWFARSLASKETGKRTAEPAAGKSWRAFLQAEGVEKVLGIEIVMPGHETRGLLDTPCQ